MKTNIINPHRLGARPRGPSGALPDDLRHWMGEDRLVRLVLEAMAEFDPQQTPRRDFAHAGRTYSVATLLTLLTYCYASGRYGSQEIEESFNSDPMLQYLCAGNEPPSTAIRRFRRVYRGPLSVSLLRVFLAVFRARDEDGTGQSVRNRSASLEIDAAKAAEAAIGKAVVADTAALDF